MNKVEPWHNETPETIKILEKSADMQVETKTEVENVNAVIEGNVETIEGENFLGSPLVTKVAHEETSRVADDYQAAEKPTQAEKEVPKNETIREDKLENQHVEIVENKEASLEKFKQNTFKELRSSEKDEKGVAMTEEKTDSESHKQTLDMLVASSGQNAGALVQTPDLTEDENMDSGKLKEASDKEESIDSAFSTKTPSIEENKREASFQEGEEKEPEASSHSMGKEMDIETIQPSKSIENKKNEGEEMPPDATKNVRISTETASPNNQKEEEATENCTGPNDKTGSPLITTLIDETSSENAGLDVGGKLEENSSIAFEERRQEAVEPSEKMRSMTFIQDEIEEKSNSESSFDKKMEDVLLQKVGKSETFKEVPETGADDIVKERENEVKNQNEVIENTVTADSSLSSTYEDDGNPEPKFMKHEESSHREGEELAPVEASTVEYRDEGLSVIVEDNIEAAEPSKSEISKHRIHPEHSFLPENEPGKEKLENSLDMASEEIQSTASNEHAETNTQVEEQRPIESPEDILDKTRKGEEINADDINKKEIPEKKTLSTSEKTETAEVEIPNKEAIDLYVTNPHVEVTVQTGGEKLDKVPTSVLDEQFHETDGVPIQENRHVNEAYEASNKLKRNSLDQTANEGKLEGELTSGVRDMEVDKLEKVFELDSEEKLQVKDAANNTKEEMQQEEEAINTELQRITTKGDNEKSKTDEDEPVQGGNKICSAEGADQLNFQENENGKNNSEAAASELNDGERSYEADNETDNNDRDINKEVKDTELEAPENTETTESDKDTEIVRSKAEEDLNLETEASALTKPFLEEESKKASEKPVDVSSTVPEEIEEIIKEEKVEDADICNDNTDAAATVVTKETSLWEIQQDDKSVKASDTSPDSEIATIQTTVTSLQGEEIASMKLDESYRMVYQPLKIEETSHETGTSLPVAITDTDEIEEEIKKYPEAISEPRYNNVEAVTDGEVTSNQTLPAEKLEDETETIKEKIIDGESCTKELPEISGGTANEVKDPELEAPENLETTDSNKDTETVRSKVEEDLNLETEASAITKPFLEEELKKASEKPVDVSSSVPEEIDAAATLVTKETSLGEIQQDDKSVKASGTSPDSETLATIQTTETSLQGEEIASMKLEETTQMVYQPPKIEETFYETGTSLPVANTDTDEIEEEIKKFPEGISEPRYDNVEAVTDGEVTSNQTLPAEKLEDETETIKENILDGESCTKELHVISGGTVNEIEEASRETGTSLLVGNTDTEEIKKIPEAISEPRYNNVEAVTDGEVTSNPTLPAEKLEEETEAIKEKIIDGESCTKELHVISGGTVNEFEETSHETGTSLPVAITDTDEIEEEIKKNPEAISEPGYNNVEAVTDGEVTSNQTLPAEKLEDETETIKEKIIEGESCTKELHVISGGTVNEVKDPEPEAPENLETTDSNKEIETVRSKVEEDLNSETEASAITKPRLEEELKKASEKPVDVSSSVSEEIDAAATVTIKETSLGEVQQDDNSVNASDSSPDFETLAAIQTTETSLQGEEIASMKLEETSRMVYQPPKIEETSPETGTSLPVGNTDRDEIEEEIKKVPEPIEKALDELEAGSYSHGSEASGTRSISTSTEEVSAEVDRAEENENIKEQKIEGESCTKELHLISGETVNEVKNPELEAPENLETTDSNKDTETVRSKAEEDLNSETEASVLTKPFLEEELKKASENPVDVSSSVPEEIEEKIKEEKVEDADNCNDKTDAAATVVTKETSLAEIPQDDKSVNASDTSPDSETLATIQTTETSLQGDEIASMKLEEISQMVYQLPKIEHENAENESTDFKNSDSGEVGKAKNLDGVSESEDQCVEETHEIGTSLTVGKIDTNETEEEIKKVPETVSEPRYNSIEEGIDGEISNQTLPAEKLEEQLQVPSSVLLFKEQDLDKITTIEKIEDGGTKNKETELDSMKLEETSAMESQLLTIEHENADQFSVTVEKSDADEIKLEQTKILDSVSESKVQSCEEIHETGRSLTMEKIGADETEEEIKEVPATISGTRHQGVESVTNDEMIPDQTLPAENLEDQLQGPSSASLYKEQERETTTIIENTEDDSTKKDETEVDSIILEETSGMVSQLPTMDMNATVEKLDAGEMKIEETKTSDAVCESRDRGVEDIYETGTITMEKNDADKMVEEIKEAPETISEPRYQGVETVSDGEITPDQTFPAGEMDGQLHVPSSVLLPKEQEHETTATVKKIEDESTKKDEAEIGNMKLEESSAMASQLPKIDREIADNMNVTVESSDADEVEAEVTKISIAAYDSRDRGVEEIHESGTSLTVGKTDTDKIEEIKEVPEIISGPKYQGVEAVTEVGITPEQTLPARKSEQQLQEPSSVFLFKERDHETTTTIEKIEDESTKKDHTQVNEDLDSSLATGTMEETCLQKEKPREIGVAELELKLIEETKKDSPNEAQKEESTALEEAPAVEPQVYVSGIINADLPSDSEKRYIQCSSQDTLTGEDILDSENPNKETDDLPSSHSIVKEILPGEVVEKCEEASNLKFEKTGKVLELVSEVHSPEVLTKPEEMKIMKEPLGAATGELRTKDNQSEEITEANETIKNELSSKKIKEESDVAKNSSVMSDEEMVTRSNQEDELRAEECSGEKTNEKNEITKKEISNKEFDELERTGVNKNVEEIIMGEDGAVENTYQVADGNQTANNNLLEEAEEGKNAKRAHTDLELKDQGDEAKCRDIAAEGTALNEEVNSTEVVSVKPNEDRIGASDKEIVIRKDEELQNSNLDDLPVTGAAAEEAPDKRVGEKIEEVSKLAPREPTYKIIKTDEENKETAMANTNNSESIMDDERPQCTSLELACSGSDVIEGLNLKEQEIYANEQSTLSHTDTSQKEMEDREREKILDEKQHDLKFDEQKPDEVSIGGGGKNITCEGEHRHEEEPVKLSTRGNESKLDEAEVHNTITAIEGESQVQNEEMRLNVLADIKDSIMTISQEDGRVDLAEDNETTKDTQELKKTTLALSDQHSPRESDSNEGTEPTISSGNKDVTPVQKDPIAKTFQNAEEEDLKAENASGAEPEEKGVECGEEKRMGDECGEKTEKTTSIESTRISLSNLLQGTTKETSQVAKHLTEERELVVNKEELQTENTEIARVEAAKTEDERNEEAGGEEHKREDLGPDAPVMVEASRDVEVKIVNKKSHNLLSGVGSKVKHSIAKVKKVITGKASQCSHPKTESHHW